MYTFKKFTSGMY